MDSLIPLTTFVQVADSGSFVAAGQRLGISASAVGKTISRLEASTGVRLFHRSTRSLTLTPEGARFLERCRRIQSEIEAAEHEFSEVSTRPKGKLRVSLPFLGEPFISTLAKFQRTYPEVELDADFADRMVDLLEEGFDAVLRTGPIEDSRLTTRRLGTFRMMLVASPGYLAEQGAPVRPADLPDHRCILFRFPETGKFQPWLLQTDQAGPAPIQLSPATICNSIEARLGYALEGAGIAYLPDFSVRDHIADGRLSAVLDSYATYSNTFHLLWASGRHAPPKLRAFIDFFGRELPLNP